MDAGHLLKEGWPYLATSAPGFWALWKVLSDSRKAKSRERADLVKIAQDAAGGQIERLEHEIDRLGEKVKALEGELNLARKEHADTITAKDAELAILRGQLRQALALADVYERKLTEAGIAHEKPRQPFWGVDAGEGPTDLVEGQLP